MRRFITLVWPLLLEILVFGLLFVACNAYGYGTPEASSWRVRVTHGRMSDLGSATAIGPQLLVTAGHVVDFAAGVPCIVYRGETKLTGRSIAASHDPTDMAVILLDEQVKDWVPLGAAPKMGQAVTAYGYGSRGILRSGSGTVREVRGGHEFESSIQIESGDSGCGLFDANGSIVGVNAWCEGSQRTADGANTGPSVSVSVEWLSKFSNIDTTCPGGVCPVRPGGGIFSPQINIGGGRNQISPMLPVQPSAPAPQLPVPSPATPVAPGVFNNQQILQIAQDFENRLKKLEQNTPMTGPPGPAGPQGPTGPAGADGAPGQQGDIQAAIDASLGKLILPVQVLDERGQIVQQERIPLNGQHSLKLQLVPIAPK